MDSPRQVGHGVTSMKAMPRGTLGKVAKLELPHASVPSSSDCGVRARAARDAAEVRSALSRFREWLARAGPTSYDQYDWWATPYGIFAKGAYYRHGTLAAPLVAPLIILDNLCPGIRILVARKRRFPIADAHYIQGFIALHCVDGSNIFLAAAQALASEVVASACPGYSALGWGYPFDWQTKRGMVRAGTPLTTTTPYVFDALLQLYAVTGQDRYRRWAASAARFMATHIRHEAARRGRAASYTPLDRSHVVNASAYSSACLATAGRVFNEPRYLEAAAMNAAFVVAAQLPDGSWPYSESDPHDAFVDNFHTCFVLKGLYRAYLELRTPELLEAVHRGLMFYRRFLLYPSGLPRPFARGGSALLRKLELYDFAEGISLGMLLAPHFNTIDITERLATEIIQRWQTRGGWFLTRVSRVGLANRSPYHRWAQAQTFRALAVYLARLQAISGDAEVTDRLAASASTYGTGLSLPAEGA